MSVDAPATDLAFSAGHAPAAQATATGLSAARAGMAPLIASAEAVAGLLKALGHDGRLTILCHLRGGEKNVSELEALLSARQAIVSQQLARLRLEGLVQTRREGQAIFYSLADRRVGALLDLLARQIAADAAPGTR